MILVGFITISILYYWLKKKNFSKKSRVPGIARNFWSRPQRVEKDDWPPQSLDCNPMDYHRNPMIIGKSTI
jgi:hypothetical protein